VLIEENIILMKKLLFSAKQLILNILNN